MNIDDLKNTWNDDVSCDTPEISIEHTNKIHLPLEKVRKNMRIEFWYTLVVFVLAFVLMLMVKAPFRFKFYIIVLLASMVLVTSFFFSRFFKLYKEISAPMLTTYDSLKDLMQQFHLNKQYYLSFYLSFVPFLVCEIIIVLECIPRKVPLSDLRIAVVLLSSVFFGLILLYFAGNLWFKRFYGKHIDKIENLLHELKK